MTQRIRITLAQSNPCVGDLAGNARHIAHAAAQARDAQGADLVVFPELALTGYPPEDLLLRPAFVREIQAVLEALRRETRGVTVALGCPVEAGGALHNAAVLLCDGKILATYCKQRLPNYGVFDEARYFSAGTEPCVVDVAGVPVGFSVCEDLWTPGVARQAAAAGARLLVSLNASPFHRGQSDERAAMLRMRAGESGLPIVYVNQVGGQDELVFDGQSLVTDASGELAFRAPAFETGLYPVEFDTGGSVVMPLAQALAPLPAPEAAVYRAVQLGLRDYVEKNGFPGVLLGLSGGIDSALGLALAVDALGPDRVEAVMMPARYTADISVEDARAMARGLGVTYRELSIEGPFQALLDVLQPVFDGAAPDLTEENLQSRCRGLLLMALSNKQGKMVLATGNKSEYAVGYATLYGDMAGGYAPLKDVDKLWVYRLSRWRNAQGETPVIPERIITRPPSAELAPGQQDQDSLPPYEVLDPILRRLVEGDARVDDVIREGHDPAVVRRVARLVFRSEYKRRQAAPGPRVTRRAFGRDRRYPITSGYTEDRG